MKKQIKIILAAFSIFFNTENSWATSLDELYRDIVKSDNQGYLPMFVRNRKAPDFLFDEEVPPPPTSQVDPNAVNEVNFINQRKLRTNALLSEQQKWDNTVRAVKENRITPIELAVLEERIGKNDAKAIEIFAWMNARGIGVKQDLILAFDYYQRAIKLKVPNAEKNAALVYKAMSPEQREKLNSFEN